MNKLVTIFYTAIYLITAYGRKALIIITAFLSAVFLGMSLEAWNESYAIASLLFMLTMIVSIGRYYDRKDAEA